MINQYFKNRTNRPTNQSTYTITEEESRRISILKVWLTIMVVFIHTYSEKVGLTSSSYVVLNDPLWLKILKCTISQSISSCAVPAFFLISSILLYRKNYSWKDNIIKKGKMLLIPYFMLNSFWILFYLLLQKIPVVNIYFSNDENIILNWGILQWAAAYLDQYPFLYPLWFLRDLFVLNIIATFVKIIVNKFPNISFVVMLALWIFIDSTQIFFLNIQAICFWTFGCFIVKKKISLSQIDDIKPKLITVIYIVSLALDVISRNGQFNLVIHRVSILIGIAFWFSCMTRFSNFKMNRLLLWISSYSFSIYLFHEKNLTILKKICTKLFPSSAGFQATEYLIIPFVVGGCCLILSVILKKISPKLYNLITGSRTI